MVALLGLVAFAWTVFVVVHFKAMYERNYDIRRFEHYAGVIRTAVSDHYAELREKRARLVVEKGYDVVDRSPWEAEIENFKALTVVKRIGPTYIAEFKQKPMLVREFDSFALQYINALVEAIDLKHAPEPQLFMPKRARGISAASVVGAGMLLAVATTGYLSEGAIAAENGFIPFEACNALADEPGFMPSHSGYRDEGDGEWICGTLWKELGSQALPNNIALYVSGTESEASKVSLKLNVNVKSQGAKDLEYMASLCEKMASGLLGSPAGVRPRISKGKPFAESLADGRSFELTKDVWSTGRGYEYNCILHAQGK